MKPTLCQFVLFICILEKNIDLVSSVCGLRHYYSEDLPGCVSCPVNCSHQGRDIERCKKACGECQSVNIVNIDLFDFF